MNYANTKIRDRVVKLALEVNLFPDELESQGIVQFIRDDDGYILEMV